MCFVSRKRMSVPPMPYEVVSAVHPTSVALFSTYRVANPSRIPHSGPRELHSLRAKAVPVIQRIKTFKPVKPQPTPTPVHLDFSYIMNRYNILSVKQDITASVCQYSIYKVVEIDDAFRQLSCLSQYSNPLRHQHYRAGNPRMYTHRIEGLFCFVMSSMDNSRRPIIQKSMYVVIMFIHRIT